ncbi:MAG TPA: VIT1/CCC1 transporter family protein [Candidatus Acidoferrum sp.]|nr:VIT1/CCC1 transporter family protein [Candidatus Acidoferrum sp.]
MSENLIPSSKRILDPYDRVSEVLFGLIMVLAITGSLSAAEAGRAEVRTMLLGALGCNLAWGIIDAILYLMGCLADSSQRLRTLRALRGAEDAAAARQIIAGALPPMVAEVLQPAEYEAIRQRLNQLPEPPEQMRLRKQDYLGGLAVFLLVFLSTFPVVIPFLLMQHPLPALRVSNAIAVGMLFLTGWAYGRCAGRRPWLSGVVMVVVGLALVGLTMALGG